MSSDEAPIPPESTSSHGKKTNFGRLAIWSVMAFILFAGAFAFFGVFDGMNLLRKLTLAPLAPAKGTIKFGTEPLTFGHLLTRPVSGGRGSLGVIESDGSFVLKTDVDGRFVEGAEVGMHKVVVQSQQGGVALGAAAAPSAVESKYTSFETTPLTIEVTRDPTKNNFSLVAEKSESKEHAPANPGEQKSTDATPAPTNPALIVLQQRLPGVDLDGDGKYTRDELIRAKSKAVNKFIELDADGNATLEGSELEQLAEFLTKSADGN